MKRHILYLIIYISITSLLTACENEIPYSPKLQDPQLIMNALLNAGEKENFVYLNLSGTQNIQHVEDATVTLYINGKEAEIAEVVELPEAYSQNNSIPEIMKQKKFRLSSSFKPGDVLRLEAIAEEGQYHVIAEVKVPQPINPIQVDTCLTYIKNNDNWGWYRQFKIAIQDRPDERNYYRLDIQHKLTLYGYNSTGKDTIATEYKSSTLVNREDVVLTDGHSSTSDDEDNGIVTNIPNKYNVFTDNRFLNANYTLKVYDQTYDIYSSIIYSVHRISESITVRLFSITEKEYLYLRALNTLESDDYDETIMEPIILPHNVEGGLGFVGVSSETKATLQLPDQFIDLPIPYQ